MTVVSPDGLRGLLRMRWSRSLACLALLLCFSLSGCSDDVDSLKAPELMTEEELDTSINAWRDKNRELERALADAENGLVIQKRKTLWIRLLCGGGIFVAGIIGFLVGGSFGEKALEAVNEKRRQRQEQRHG